MTKVFLGGSRQISRLNPNIRERIANILSKKFDVLIGDANGADKAIQRYLAQKEYQKVTVFCSGKECRNNLGNWTTEFVATDRRARDFRYYEQKDVRMSNEADYGLFLWDGLSKGTLNNVLRLLAQNKDALLYLSPRKMFVTIKDTSGLDEVIGHCDPKTAAAVRHALETKDHLPNRQSQFDLA